MTTNQTIDGVPREQLARWEEMLRTPPGRQELLGELRALLDAPNKNAFSCWSCKKPVTMRERADADGNCPHCDVELDVEGWLSPLVSQPPSPRASRWRGSTA